MSEPSDREQRLQSAFRRLPAPQQEMVLEFAEYLLERYGEELPPEEPIWIARPEDESVVGAIKRLRTSYPMLDAQALLAETSELMSQHLTGGREAEEIIDELEKLFHSHFEKFRE
jgi:hypothetical protein